MKVSNWSMGKWKRWFKRIRPPSASSSAKVKAFFLKASSISILFRVLVLLYVLVVSVRMISTNPLSSTPKHFPLSIEYQLKDYKPRKLPSRIDNRQRHLHLQRLAQSNNTNNINVTLALCQEWFRSVSSLNFQTTPPTRLSAYIPECLPHTTYFGYVFRDLVNRFFPDVNSVILPPTPILDQSTILIVSPRAKQAEEYYQKYQQQQQHPHATSNNNFSTNNNNTQQDWGMDKQRRREEESLQQQFGYTLGPSLLLTAKHRGYAVKGLDPAATTELAATEDGKALFAVDAWWNEEQRQNKGTQLPPSNVFLALLDPGNLEELDRLVEVPDSTFLAESNIQYLIYKVVITQHAVYGRELTKFLSEKGYHVQVLSASHAPDPSMRKMVTTATNTRRVSPTKTPSSRAAFAPNTLLETPHDVANFFQYRRIFHSNYRNQQQHGIRTQNRYRRTSDNITNAEDDQRQTKELPDEDLTPNVYVAYLFATKRLDLAIPSAQAYINLTGKEEADLVLDVDGDRIPFRSCRKSLAKLRWNPKKHRPNTLLNGTDAGGSHLSPTPTVISQCDLKGKVDMLWHSSHTEDTSEFFCLVCANPTTNRADDRRRDSIGCISRFLPAFSQSNDASLPLSSSGIGNANVTLHGMDRLKHMPSSEPNLIYIELSQVSLERFRKTMPQTRSALEVSGIFSFDHFLLTEAPNSTSSWHPLDQYDDLIDNFHAAKYAVLDVVNGCTTRRHSKNETGPLYGRQLNEVFCTEQVSRPNCIGGLPASKFLLNYTSEFIQYHLDEQKPFAAFLSFIEGQNDAAILSKTLDVRLSTFLSKLKESMTKTDWDRTAIIFTSNSGLSYGTYSQSFKGQQEIINPILYMKAPSKTVTKALQLNRRLFIVPDDVARTVRKLSLNQAQKRYSETLFSSLPDSRVFCESTDTIPSSFCKLTHPEDHAQQKELSLRDPLAPSVLSFYADIPKKNRAHMSIIPTEKTNKRADVYDGCMCATNVDKWSPCSVHPWTKASVAGFKQYFMLVECPDKPTHLELRMVRNPILLARVEKRISKEPIKELPNILFLEIDSVSVAYADRHFPKTRELLRQYRVRKTENGYMCPYGICSADFSNRISLAGANSIPNQVAALSGCLSSDYDHACGIEEPDINMICEDRDEPHYGLQVQRVRSGAKQVYWCPPQPDRKRRISPWLYSITDSLGYINFFGEEFCYEGSPYVTQGNVYPAFYGDLESHHVFCRLAEQRILRANATVEDQFRWGWERQDQPCVDSRAQNCTYEKAKISLEMIKQQWTTYPDIPKLAFLNVLAAHVYNADWSRLYPLAERYDDHLSNMLEFILSRQDADNTIIIVRSDHGLQRGPMAMDYSLQTEHARPWTEILIPESLQGVSKEALYENQDRLMSGYDVYHTIRAAMARGMSGTSSNVPPIAYWTYDLASERIPENRTCLEARVDSRLCREESRPPNFGICNALDRGQVKFCHDHSAHPDLHSTVNAKLSPAALIASKNTSAAMMQAISQLTGGAKK